RGRAALFVRLARRGRRRRPPTGGVSRRDAHRTAAADTTRGAALFGGATTVGQRGRQDLHAAAEARRSAHAGGRANRGAEARRIGATGAAPGGNAFTLSDPAVLPSQRERQRDRGAEATLPGVGDERAVVVVVAFRSETTAAAGIRSHRA